MKLDKIRAESLFVLTDDEIRKIAKKQINQKKRLSGGKWKFKKHKKDTTKIGGDGIPELTGYNLSSVWKDITHEKAEFYPHSIALLQTGKGSMSIRYSRTNLQAIERVIKTYMRNGDLFLENCCGWSTFGTMAAYYGYNGIGIDIWDTAIEMSIKQYNEIIDLPGVGKLEIVKMDGMNMEFDDNSFDYIYCNPPFMDSEMYSKLENDIADKDFDKFLTKIDKLMSENYRVCKVGKLCTMTINDKREKGYMNPLHIHLINSGLIAGFKLWDIAIAELVKGRNLIRRKREYELKRTAKQHEYVITFIKP